MSAQFVHLRVHTEYSMIDGLLRINGLLEAVARLEMSTVAVTDHCNLFATIKFYQAAVKRGIKPIIGCDVLLANDQEPPFRLSLLCQDKTGYQNLIYLISKAYTDGQQQGVPLLQKDWLAEHADGLIALSGEKEGDIGRALLANQMDKARELAGYWQKLFPDRFYLELQRLAKENEELYINAAVDLAVAMDLPVVASNYVCFLSSEDFEAHEARVCIHQGSTLADKKRPRIYSQQQYLRTPEQMVELFSDIPTAIENTLEIAKRCNVQLSLGDAHLPNFSIPVGYTATDYLAGKAQEGLDNRLPVLFAEEKTNIEQLREPYDKRLKKELSVINGMGFAGYFLIVADFIQWAKDNNIPVGPGRGSGAGSLVAYVLGITDLDPLQYDLLFERFLNAERVSMPDFDIDFCIEGRDKVIDYVMATYGYDNVAQIITFGSMAAKAVIRDVGRVLSYPYGFIDPIAKLIPFELGITLDKALEQEDELRQRYQREEEVKTVIDLARKLEGISRNVGTHAGGVVIAPSKLTDFTALYCESGSEHVITQFDKDDVEAAGLVKFDFLGLRTLTIINWALQTVNKQREQAGQPALDITLIPTDDKATFNMLKACHTTAIFQLESRGMRDLVKRLQPDCFEEIIALVALFRPGPLQSGMVDDFIDRKHGRAKVLYPHPDVVPVLRSTYGVILYQEQVMQIAQVLAGYTLGAADVLRRAMGKKKAEEMAQQRVVFIDGATSRGVDRKIAHTIFDLMEKFAGYGFNKSHSAAYALVAYQTAWLKSHYPAAFMAAVLSSDMDNTDKIVIFIEECERMKLTVLPPDINTGYYKFTVLDEKTIVYGLGAIKGIGEAVIESITSAREQASAFQDLFDFCQRLDSRKINRRALEALIRSGTMDSLGEHRAVLMASLDAALKTAEQHSRDLECGQTDLFGALKQQAQRPSYITVPPWSERQRLQGEKETLGCYFSGHPLDCYRQELAHFTTNQIAALKLNHSQSIVVAGSVIALRKMFNKRGERMAFVTLDDGSGRVELLAFTDAYQTYKELLVKDALLVIEAEILVDKYRQLPRITIQQVLTIEQARELHAKGLRIDLNDEQISAALLTQLAEQFKEYQGQCAVYIRYHHKQVSAVLKCGQQWRITPNEIFLESLYRLLGKDQVTMVY